MIEIILIGLAAGCGALVRYIFSQLSARFKNWKIPWMTYVANLSGSLLIGYIFGRFGTHAENYKIFATGFCGGLTTFSTFNFELYALLEKHDYGRFSEYFVLSYGMGFIAVLAGLFLATL